MHLTDHLLYMLVFVVDSKQLLFEFRNKMIFKAFYHVLVVFCHDFFKFCCFNQDQAKVNVQFNFKLRPPVSI